MSTIHEKVMAQRMVWEAEEWKHMRHLVSPEELEYMLRHYNEWVNWKSRKDSFKKKRK